MALARLEMLVDVVSSRRPPTVQTGRAGRAVTARIGAGQHGRSGRTASTATAADVALQADTDRATATRRALSARTLSQINALILQRQLVTVGRMREQCSRAIGAVVGAGRCGVMIHVERNVGRTRLATRSIMSYLSVNSIL